jgi:hypothetical protein
MSVGIATQQAPLQLQGLSFRSEPVRCATCGWSGEAGQLHTPSVQELRDEVSYACPLCKTVVAVHTGLNDTEVLQELEHLRLELREELKAICRVEKANPGRTSYLSVRSRIRELG